MKTDTTLGGNTCNQSLDEQSVGSQSVHSPGSVPALDLLPCILLVGNLTSENPLRGVQTQNKAKQNGLVSLSEASASPRKKKNE